jgi:hypothetical protein
VVAAALASKDRRSEAKRGDGDPTGQRSISLGVVRAGRFNFIN